MNTLLISKTDTGTNNTPGAVRRSPRLTCSANGNCQMLISSFFSALIFVLVRRNRTLHEGLKVTKLFQPWYCASHNRISPLYFHELHTLELRCVTRKTGRSLEACAYGWLTHVETPFWSPDAAHKGTGNRYHKSICDVRMRLHGACAPHWGTFQQDVIQCPTPSFPHALF